MKAYKASLKQKCINITYEVGKTYTFTGKIIPCLQGFHFCKHIDDVITYYGMNKDVVIFEIDVTGNVIDGPDESIVEGPNKSVTDEFKVIRIIPQTEYNDLFKTQQFDENLNLVYYNYGGGEVWLKYNEDGKVISEKRSDGYELLTDYNNNVKHTIDSFGTETWEEHDKNNNEIRVKSKGREGTIQESTKEYNEKNQCVCRINCYQEKTLYEYDSRGNLVQELDCDVDGEHIFQYGYDENNNKISFFANGRNIRWYDYDKNNNEIHIKFSSGYEAWKQYDENNNCIFFQESRTGLLKDAKSYSISIT